jgi:hypothetical protein
MAGPDTTTGATRPGTGRITGQPLTPAADAGPASQASIAELVRQLSDQSTRLIHQEIELAKAELTVKGKRAGLGAGMFGGAGIFGFYAVGALTAAGILALALAVTAWLSALIVAAVLAIVAGAMALTGKNKVQQAVPPTPQAATESVREDVQYAKSQAQAARQ